MSLIHVFLAGDSTMSHYDDSVAPRKGWGQVLGGMMKENVRIHNEAVSGRSSKSFIDEGWFAKIEERIGAGDYLLIQFGHNDQKSDVERHTDPYTTYQTYLQRYIDMARSKQAHPVLITPVQRRTFDASGKFVSSHGEYPAAMKQLAEKNGVPLIDLAASSGQLLESLGAEKSKALYLWFKPGELPNYPDGAEDDSHFSEYGAKEIAKLVLRELRESGHPLSQYVII